MPDDLSPEHSHENDPLVCLEFALDVRASRSSLVRALAALEQVLRAEDDPGTADAVALLGQEAAQAPDVADGLRCVFAADELPGVGLSADGLTAAQLAGLATTTCKYAENRVKGRVTRVVVSALVVGSPLGTLPPPHVFHPARKVAGWMRGGKARGRARHLSSGGR